MATFKTHDAKSYTIYLMARDVMENARVVYENRIRDESAQYNVTMLGESIDSLRAAFKQMEREDYGE